MAWMSKFEAALALGVSVRTLERRIVAGELKARRDGRSVIVDVADEDDREPVADLDQHLKEPGRSHVPQKAEAAEELRGVLWALTEYRRELGRRIRRARISAGVGWTAVAAMIIVMTVGAWRYGTTTKAHESDLRLLQMAHSREWDRLQTEADRAQETVGKLAATRKELGEAQEREAELRDAVARLSADLAVVAAERDRVYKERDRLVEAREAAALERDGLVEAHESAASERDRLLRLCRRLTR